MNIKSPEVTCIYANAQTLVSLDCRSGTIFGKTPEEEECTSPDPLMLGLVRVNYNVSRDLKCVPLLALPSRLRRLHREKSLPCAVALGSKEMKHFWT